jgi:poly-beta-1,6-N-acetyl-D-glucosamine synthase
MSREMPKIVVITPCRNEEKYLPDLISCMKSQSLQPAEWIVIDDGSADATARIVKEATTGCSWLRLFSKNDRGARSVGPGVVESFYHGFARLETKDWDYICKLDADIRLPERYFEKLVEYFEKDPLLGEASGKLFLELAKGRFAEERIFDEAVWGCANFYRRKCFEDVGGFVRSVMWDGIVFHRARMEGWRTRSIRDPQLRITDRRLMGSSDRNVLVGRRRWGMGQYFMGTHPLFILAVGVYRCFERPFVLGGLSIVFGYFAARFKRIERYAFPGFRESLHAWQFERLRIGRRIERIPDPPAGLYPA